MSKKMNSVDVEKKTADDGFPSNSLPLRHNLKLAYLFSLLITLLTAGASIAGLLYSNYIYPTVELQQTFLPNDIVNLFIGLPILLVSMWLAWRGKLIGLLFWPGALFYGLYNYIVYLFAMPFNVMFLFYLVIVTLSIYTTIGLVASIDGVAVKQRLNGRVPERAAGAVLAVLGSLFALRVIAEMVGSLSNQTPIGRTELALLVADFIISAAFIVGGVLLWRTQALGYVCGTGLLFQLSMLFIGLIIILLLQPFLTDAPFAPVDVIVVFAMGLICFIPFALFLRGVIKS